MRGLSLRRKPDVRLTAAENQPDRGKAELRERDVGLASTIGMAGEVQGLTMMTVMVQFPPPTVTPVSLTMRLREEITHE